MRTFNWKFGLFVGVCAGAGNYLGTLLAGSDPARMAGSILGVLVGVLVWNLLFPRQPAA